MKELVGDSTVGTPGVIAARTKGATETEDSPGGEDLRGGMAGEEVVLFLVPAANHFCGAEACETGCEQCQAERFGHRPCDAGERVNRQEQDSRN